MRVVRSMVSEDVGGFVGAVVYRAERSRVRAREALFVGMVRSCGVEVGR